MIVLSTYLAIACFLFSLPYGIYSFFKGIDTLEVSKIQVVGAFTGLYVILWFIVILCLIGAEVIKLSDII